MIRALPLLALVLLVLGCGRADGPVRVTARSTGLEIEAAGPMERVQLWDGDETLLRDQPLPVPSERAFLTVRLAPGVYTVGAGGRRTEVQVAERGPVEVALEAPIGQGRRSVADGERVGVLVLGQERARAAVVLTAATAAKARVTGPEGTTEVVLEAPGDRGIVSVALDAQPVELVVEAGGERTAFTLVPERMSLEQARERVQVVSVRLPTDALGAIDRARPPDRITLPSPWWRRFLQQTGLGYRPRDDQAPWAWQSVTLENTADAPVTLVVRSVVLDDDGEPAPAFRPRLRESVGDAVQALIRVPPGRATASLPVFAMGSEVDETRTYTRRIEVVPLGGEVPLHVVERPLFVSRGSPWASGWLVAALVTSGAGWLWLLLGAPRWIRRARTADLVTVAQFASVTWVAATALQVAGLGVSTVLGPFAPLLTGIADDALRACLLGTLIALVPRPGTAALATAIGFVMRGLTLGTFHPVDLLYLGSAVFWLELWLWVAGCTRGSAWRDRPVELWARLSLGLAASNVCAIATALVVSVVFYRLYFAGWYVGLILALPGCLYVVMGCALAVGFSRALRRVEG